MASSKLSEYIKHSANCEFYGNSTKERTVELLIALYKNILEEVKQTPFISSKKRYLELAVEIEKLLSEYKKDFKNIFKNEIKVITETEIAWLSEFLKDTIKDIVIPTTIISSLKFSPIASQTNYETVVDNIANNIYTSVDATLRNGYMTKESTDILALRIEKKENKIISNVETETATFNTTAFVLTDYLIYKANNRKVIYKSILDSHTCLSCASYSEKEFTAKEAPIPPLHENCRCILVDSEIINKEEDLKTYNQWFETLQESEKLSILGKGRYQLYKSGISLDRFVSDGQVLTLEELQKS